MYGDQPAGWDTAGTPETVNNIKRDDILKYKNSHYHASNAVVAVAGNIDPEVAFSKVERAFKNMSDGRKITKLKVRERQKNPRVKFKKKDLDQTHLRLGARSYEMYDERRYALQVLATILGGNCSSYLWREIREKRGLAYYVGASAEEYTDSGYLLATAGVAHENLPKAVKKIVEIMRHLRTKGVSDKEINFAKEYIRGSMALEDILRKIEAVKRSDIIKVAKDIFRPEKINLAAIGPHEEGQVYEKILAQI